MLGPQAPHGIQQAMFETAARTIQGTYTVVQRACDSDLGSGVPENSQQKDTKLWKLGALLKALGPMRIAWVRLGAPCQDTSVPVEDCKGLGDCEHHWPISLESILGDTRAPF